MSVQIQTVEFERREAHLSELEDGAPWTVHGVALGAGDVTVGQSGIKKLWPADELKKSAETLEGRNLVVDHNNESDGVVGQVTKAGYKDNVGVIYEAELFDEELAEKINNGLLEVSIRGKHIDVDTMEENEEGAKIVEGIKFDNLSIVPTGAAPSNTLEMGETEELSVAELAAFADSLESAELAEIEPGMWVKGDDMRGITISAVEDGEVEVDIYEESDDKWRSTGETEMVSTDGLSEWDVDEEEDIGSMEDEEEDEEENSSTTGDVPTKDAEPEHDPMDDDESEQEMKIPDKFFFESENEAMSFIEDKDGLTGVHEMDKGWLPGADHDEFMEWWDNQSSQSKHKDGGLENLRSEGEEQVIGKDISEEDAREQQPERFPDGETANEQLEGSIHEPTYSGDDDDEWNKPSLNDFTDESWEDLSDEEKSDIGGHFIFSMTGFPADNYSDMKLPVVRPNGTLSMNAVRNAKSRLSQTDGLSDDQRDRVESMLNEMLGEDEEEAAYGKRRRTIDDTGHEKSVEDSGPVDVALNLINKYLKIEGKHERDSVDKMLGWLFGANDLPMETVSDFRTASNAFLDQTAGTDSFEGMTVEQFRDWLLMHGDGSRGRREQDGQERGELPPGFATPVHVLTGDDLQQSKHKSGESELDDATLQVTTMTNEEIEQKLAELNEPVAVEQSDLEELQQKADRFEEMSDTLESLKERTDVLDEADREQVEELAEADEPVVVESARMEQLEGEAEQVKTVYAAALSDELGAFSAEELAGKFSIEELREKYEEQIGDPAEELASSESAEPQSGDPSEEELEEQAEQESEELSEEDEEAEQMRAELKEKILSR
jgi:hypothetical protein